MIVRFWGTRGSLPTAVSAAQVRQKLISAFVAAMGRQLDSAEKVTAFIDTELPFSIAGSFGGNSACVQIETGSSEFVLCDCGSGARQFGNYALARSHSKGRYHIFMSHLHWDHIMGFPFLVPAYLPGNRITLYGCHSGIREAFIRQQSAPYFPVDFSALLADIDFVTLQPGSRYDIAGMSVTPKRQLHGGESYGYRFESNGKALVYSTDAEHKQEDPAESAGTIDFFRNADAVIFDAMYSLADSMSIKEDWGHSSNMVGVELCQLAGAKRLVLFHHEPTSDDSTLAAIQSETERLEEITRSGTPLKIVTAYDGLEIAL